jgi:hypothetical protein
MISGEVRRSIIVGIGAVTLDNLHAELIIEPRLPGRDVVWARCVTAVATKKARKEQGGTIPPRCGS